MADLTRCKAFLRSFQGAHDDWADAIETLEAKVSVLQDAIQDVLDDGEGMDVTVYATLQHAFDETGGHRAIED
jgi:hypothetical protein